MAMMNDGTPKWVVPGVILALAQSAAAHPAHQTVGSGFSSGFIHPIAGLDHLAAMVAVGLWGEVLGGKLKWQLPVIFPLVMAVGAALGVRGMPLPWVETWIALSGMLIGLAVFLQWRPVAWIAWVLVSLFAVFHGHAHGSELPQEADPLIYGIGFVLATGMLHLLGIGIGEIQRITPHGEKVVRAAGGVLAAVGCWFLLQGIRA